MDRVGPGADIAAIHPHEQPQRDHTPGLAVRRAAPACGYLEGWFFVAGAEGIGVEHDMGWWDSVGTVKVVVCDVETVAVGAVALASAKVVDTMVVRSVVVRGAGRTHAAGAAGDVSFDAEQDVLVVVFEGAGADGCFAT